MLRALGRIRLSLISNSRRYCQANLTSWPLDICQCDDVIKADIKYPSNSPYCYTRKGLILGIYCSNSAQKQTKALLTATAEKYNNTSKGKLMKLINICGSIPQIGEYRTFYDLEPEFSSVVLVGLGSECFAYDEHEIRDESKEVIRIAAGVGAKVLQSLHTEKIFVESFGHAESAAEGAGLAIWVYQEYKNFCEKTLLPFLNLFDDCDHAGWNLGIQKAAAQNLCRYLTELPANHLSPNKFAQISVDLLCRAGVNVEVHVEGWAKSHSMGGFLAASKGSCEPPVFLEMTYFGGGCNCKPLILIGKGLTYDSGGLNLSDHKQYTRQRGAMEGAAHVVATIRAAALLKLPINIRGLLPIAENLPGCSAVKVGDIITTADGRNLKIDDPHCLGQVLVGEALAYARHHSPRILLDIGNMSPGIIKCTGKCATACFTNNDLLWGYMKLAAAHSGDRLWRYPLWAYYEKFVKTCEDVDLDQIGNVPMEADPCIKAAFLRQYVCEFDWIHLDTYGVTWAKEEEDFYLRTGFSGRPVRTIIDFLYQLIENEAI